MLRAVGITKSFRAPSDEVIPVLTGVELTVAAGELAVIVGASGSGKSTLLNVLGLLEDADAGEVFYDGRLVSGLSRSAKSRERGRWLGFVFQAFLLLPSLTALDNVLLAARYVGRAGADARRRGGTLLQRLGVAHLRDHYSAPPPRGGPARPAPRRRCRRVPQPSTGGGAGGDRRVHPSRRGADAPPIRIQGGIA